MITLMVKVANSHYKYLYAIYKYSYLKLASIITFCTAQCLIRCNNILYRELQYVFEHAMNQP